MKAHRNLVLNIFYWKTFFLSLFLQIRNLPVFRSIMGCTNGKPALSEDDLEFIANNTAITR